MLNLAPAGLLGRRGLSRDRESEKCTLKMPKPPLSRSSRPGERIQPRVSPRPMLGTLHDQNWRERRVFRGGSPCLGSSMCARP